MPIWPKRFNLFNVEVSATNYKELLSCVIDAAHTRTSACVSHMPVHGLITAMQDPYFKDCINTKFDVAAPDGQPVRWALNNFYKTSMADRVYGPDFTLMVCKAAEEQKLPVYFYGSTVPVLEKLKQNLLKLFPDLIIAGLESPPFKKLNPQEDAETIDRINASGAGIVFIGLGCPKQEVFAAEHKNKINAVMICVGAAFDFHAGMLKQAPAWMQKKGLEWLFRLLMEPRRLFKRYFVTNTLFIVKVIGWKLRR